MNEELCGVCFGRCPCAYCGTEQPAPETARPSRVIISRHAAAVSFVALELGGVEVAGPQAAANLLLDPDGRVLAHKATGCVSVPRPDGTREEIPVIASAATEDVEGREVYGNVPLHLAAAAAVVVVIEFAGQPPRGQEYTLEDMRAAGARLCRYKVVRTIE